MNLGDVTSGMTRWRKNAGTLRAQPGRKIVVLGNHDFTKRRKAAQTGFDEAWITLLLATDPPLVFTHLPPRGSPGGRRQRPRARSQQRTAASRPLRQHLRGAHRLLLLAAVVAGGRSARCRTDRRTNDRVLIGCVRRATTERQHHRAPPAALVQRTGLRRRRRLVVHCPAPLVAPTLVDSQRPHRRLSGGRHRHTERSEKPPAPTTWIPASLTLLISPHESARLYRMRMRSR